MLTKQKSTHSEEYLKFIFASGYMGKLEEAVLAHFGAGANLVRLPKNLDMPGNEMQLWILNSEPEIKSKEQQDKIIKDTLSKIDYLSGMRTDCHATTASSTEDSLYTTCFFAIGMLNEKMGYFLSASASYKAAASYCIKSGNLSRALNFVNHAEFLYNLWGEEGEIYNINGRDFAQEIKEMQRTIISQIAKD